MIFFPMPAATNSLVNESVCYSKWSTICTRLSASQRCFRISDYNTLSGILSNVPILVIDNLIQERKIKREGEILTFKKTLEEEEEIINTSLYMVHIERYFEVLSCNQMFFLTLDNLRSQLENILLQLQYFLKVKPCELTANRQEKANPCGHSTIMTRISKLTNAITQTRILHKFLPASCQKILDTLFIIDIFSLRFSFG